MEEEIIKKKSIFRRFRNLIFWISGSLLSIFLIISLLLYVYKGDICNYVIQEVNKHLKAKVSVEKVDLAFWGTFPNLSVDFEKVFIQDSYEYAKPTDTLLFTEKIRLKFNPIDIWNEKYNVKKIDINPGVLKLKINKKGEVNYDILKPSEDTTSTKFNLNLQKVALNEIRFSFKNAVTNQYYASTFHEIELDGQFSEKQFLLNSKVDMNIDNIRNNAVSLIYNKKSHFDINIFIDQERGVFQIPTTEIFIENLPFEVAGKITPNDMSFDLKSKQLALKDVVNNFTHSAIDDINKFEGEGLVKFDLHVNGELKSDAITYVNCDFGIANGSLTEPNKKLRLNNIQLDGKYSNLDGIESEFLELKNIQLSTPSGPFKGNLKLTQFDAPHLVGDANGNIDLHSLHSIFPISGIETINGNAHINSDFEIITEYVDDKKEVNLKSCEGEINLQNISFKLVEDKREFSNINGDVYLRSNEAGIENVTVKVLNSDLKLNGVFQNIVDYIKTGSDVKADLKVESNFLNIQDLSTETKAEQISDGRNWILPSNIDGQIDLSVNELKYEKHNFYNLESDVKIGNKIIYFKNLNLKNAGANIVGGLTIEERNPEIFTISTSAKSDNIEIKPLFKEWDNFKQDVITENNIYGKIRANMDFEAPFDLRSGIDMKAIKSKVQLKISDGRLLNVEAFKEIVQSMKKSSAKLILNKASIEEFEKKILDLRFGTFENTFIIRNGQLEIPLMDINSNALDVKLEGIHGFDNQIDYRFSFRFRDLKQKKTEEEFGEIIDDGTGIKLFVRMYGNMDNPKIEWDESAKKQQAKENREKAKQDAKSILKTEFGLFQKDSTVKNYTPISKPKEELQLDFDSDKKHDNQDAKKEEKKKDSKIKNTLDKWKKQSEEKNKEDIDFN